MRPVKILTFTSLYPSAARPTHGLFVEQRLRHLVAGGGVDATVLAPVPWFPLRRTAGEHVAAFETRHGIAIHHPRYLSIPKLGMPLAPLLMARSMRRVMRRLIADGADFDLIDAHYFYPDGVAAVALGREFAKPVFVTARGSDINVFTQHAVPRRLIVRAATAAAGVITVSSALRDELIRLGVPPAKVEVLRNGVDLELFRPHDRDEARERLGVAGPTIVVVGHLKAGKGHRLVLDAMRQLPDLTLLLVGDGPLRAALERRAAELGVAERVRFLGAMRQQDLSEVYSACDASVLASAREGMPNVVLESIACGTPVVATAVGGVPEVLTGTDAGALMTDRSAAALVDALERILARPPTTAAVRAYAEKFDWQEATDGQRRLFTAATDG